MVAVALLLVVVLDTAVSGYLLAKVRSLNLQHLSMAHTIEDMVEEISAIDVGVEDGD